MRVVRNIAIIMALAFVVAAVPGGGGLADAILGAITIAFLTLIAMAGYLVYRQNRLSYLTLPDQTRTIFLLSLGGLVVSLAGADDLTETSLGLVIFLGVLASSIFGIFRVVAESREL